MNEKLLSSIILMAMGMTLVFSFLVVLVFLMQLLARVVPKLSWMLPDPDPAKPRPAPAGRKQEIALAIAAALQKFWGLR